MSVSSTQPTCASAGTAAPNLSTTDWFCYPDCPGGYTPDYPYCTQSTACPSGWTLAGDGGGCIAPTLSRAITSPGTPNDGLTCAPNTVYNASDDTCRSACGVGTGSGTAFTVALNADTCIPPCPSGLSFDGPECTFAYTTLTGVPSSCGAGNTTSDDGSACCPNGYTFSSDLTTCTPAQIGTGAGSGTGGGGNNDQGSGTGTGTGSGTGTGTGASAGLPLWWYLLFLVVLVTVAALGWVSLTSQARLHRTIQCVTSGAGAKTLSACVDPVGLPPSTAPPAAAPLPRRLPVAAAAVTSAVPAAGAATTAAGAGAGAGSGASATAAAPARHASASSSKAAAAPRTASASSRGHGGASAHATRHSPTA